MTTKNEFYVGVMLTDTPTANVDYVDSTEVVIARGRHAYPVLSLQGGSAIFFDLDEGDDDYVYFFANGELVERRYIHSFKGSVIIPPSNADAWSASFSEFNSEFLAKREEGFLYQLSKVTPHYKNLTITHKKENGQQFFRSQLSDSVKLVGAEADAVFDMGLEEQQMFFITDLVHKVRYKGTFSKTDCTYDTDKHICTFSVDTKDRYTEFLDNWDKEYDLAKLPRFMDTVGFNIRPMAQIYVLGSDTVTNIVDGVTFETSVSEPPEPTDNREQLYNTAFKRLSVNNEVMISGSGIEGVDGVYAGKGGEFVNANGQYKIKISLHDWGNPAGNYLQCKLVVASTGAVLYDSPYPFIKNGNVDFDRMYLRVVPHDQLLYIPTDDDYHLNRTVDDPNSGSRVEMSAVSVEVYGRFLYATASGVRLRNDDFAYHGSVFTHEWAMMGDSMLEVYSSAETSEKPTKYYQTEDGKYFKKPTRLENVNNIVPISKNDWAYASIWADVSMLTFPSQAFKHVQIRDALSIAHAIQALLSKVAPTVKHVGNALFSRFFYATEPPLQGLQRFYTFITQKSNAMKGGTYDTAAQTAKTTLKDLLEAICMCFRCGWHIDEDNRLIIEHISYYLNGGTYDVIPTVGFDLTQNVDQFNGKPIGYFQTSLSFDKTELSSRYEFGWMDECTGVFNGPAIDVKAKYVDKSKKESVTPADVTSDLTLMMVSPEDMSKDGFALMCALQGEDGSYEIPTIDVQGLRDEYGNVYNAKVQNYHASWSYLQRLYMYDMPAYAIKHDLTPPLTVLGIKRCMRHTVRVRVPKDFDALAMVRTTEGEGVVEEWSEDIDTGFGEMVLSYLPC